MYDTPTSRFLTFYFASWLRLVSWSVILLLPAPLFIGSLPYLLAGIACWSLVSSWIATRRALQYSHGTPVQHMRATLSVLGLMAVMVLLPFGVVAFQDFTDATLGLLTGAMLWICVHGIIVYGIMHISSSGKTG